MKLPRLRPDQSAIAAHPAQIKVIACGRRFGKSLMGGTLALSAAAKGGSVAWVVPTYRNARAMWRFVEQHAAGHGDLRRSEMSVQFRRGHVTVYTADNDVAIRGEAFDLVIVDECAQIREETYTDVIMPTLADRNGRALLISTPKGRNWFWREFLRGKSDGKLQASFTAPSAANPNPAIQRAALVAKSRVSERTYRQEWLAEFLDDGGIVFRYVRDRATGQAEKPRPDTQYVIGVDWGRHNDSTVFSVLDLGRKALVCIDRMQDIPYAQQVARLSALAKSYGDAAVIAESNSIGDPLIEQCQKAGLTVTPFYTSDVSKANVIDALAGAFERAEITILNDETLLGELEAYEIKRVTSKSLPVYGAPDGQHDDCVLSLAIAWRGIASSVQIF